MTALPTWSILTISVVPDLVVLIRWTYFVVLCSRERLGTAHAQSISCGQHKPSVVNYQQTRGSDIEHELPFYAATQCNGHLIVRQRYNETDLVFGQTM
jgi:hypothetical protein